MKRIQNSTSICFWAFLITVLCTNHLLVADPERQPSISPTKFIIIDSEKLGIYNFWEQHKEHRTAYRQESFINVLVDGKWNGVFFLDVNKERNQIIFRESKNGKLVKTVTSPVTDFPLAYPFLLGFYDQKLWFQIYSEDHISENMDAPHYIGYVDYSMDIITLFHVNDYFPTIWEQRSLIFFHRYKDKYVLYFDWSNWGNPTDNVKILLFDGTFQALPIHEASTD